ncbi:DUF4276 family protein [Xanthomonas melonis]|uniref:DUF4276 family protein n=1 Tax=Xanthomonas melonis TaxID=56456 RepID=A0ABS8NSD5_9XANT|nr:DUF4276 family protein [Xanthomonas melonis]MCD0244846.1 DUF4276 family protein [Xanthomonas melonis]MCD0257077.1 DUF4276 family protein [Xanthomonas melonis]MCD0265339.1 DUF4276 family protein [Xanthomonas melonis]
MVKLYVEGGGDTAALKTACREGFTTFVTKAGLKNRPRIVACGSRRDAFDSFCTAIANGEDAMLLVDSEDTVIAQHQQGQPDTWQPWGHLKARVGDVWDKPAGVADTQCHLMAQVMESWFLSDREALKAFFGQGFKENALPAANNAVESTAKQQIYSALAQATKNCKTKAAYGKGEHSFKLLTTIDPAKVTQASPWAKRFLDELCKKMDS